MIKKNLEKISIYQRNGSGWYFKEVFSLEIHIVDYKPIKVQLTPANFLRLIKSP